MFIKPHVSIQRDAGRQHGALGRTRWRRLATRFGGRLRGSPAPASTGGRMLRRAAVGAAAAVLCLSAGAGAAQAQATAPKPASMPRVAPLSHGLPHVTAVNLHREYLAQLRHVKVGKIAGTVRPRGWHATGAAKAKASCSEPNCDLTYHGGPVQHNPHVFLVFWGSDWETDPTQIGAFNYLLDFYASLGTADTWSPITAQYHDGSGFPQFAGPVISGVLEDTSTPPAGATTTQLATEADAAAANFTGQGSTINGNSQIVVATQSGTCPQGFACGGTGSYCAWHTAFSEGSFSNVSFTNLPFQPDAGAACGENFVNPGSAGTFDGFSMVGGHEYAESVTDPVPDTGWIDTADSISGGEVADKCAWGGHNWGDSDPYGDVTIDGTSFAMQSLWSNAAGGCVLAATEDTATVTNPGSQSGFTGDTVSLSMHGPDSGGNPQEWYATGLPPGLSINPGNGLISGTLTTAGSYTPEVFASDDTGGGSSASFTWTVTADTVSVTGPGNQAGYAQAAVSVQFSGTSSGGKTPLTWSATDLPAGLKLNASTGLITGAPTTAGSYPVTVTATDTNNNSGSASFTWTVQADVGKAVKESSAAVCLNDSNSIAATGNPVTIAKCNSSGAQKWTFPAPGELTVFGLCLADYSGGGSGTTLSLEVCRGDGNEVWSHKSNGEYVLSLNHLCLTDPKNSATNGTKVTVTKCTAATSQKWTKP